MRTTMTSMLVVVVLMGLLNTDAAWAGERGRDAGYKFTKIADSNGPFSSFNFPGAPSINNRGMVAFLAELDTGVGGIFAGDGESTITIADSSGPFLGIGGFGQYPSINKKGTVAFLSHLDSGDSGIFTGDDGAVTTLATQQTSILNGFGHPAINDKGTVALQASIDGGGVSIFVIRNEQLVDALENTGRFNGIQERVSLNDKGTIAFKATSTAGIAGIYLLRKGSVITIAETTGSFTAFGVPSLNDAGKVTFFACMDTINPSCPTNISHDGGIFVADGGRVAKFADTSGPFHVFGNPSINDKGQIAFVAWLDSGGSGIFTGPDSASTKVIATGDTLFGSEVVSVGYLQGIGINERGQIAFFATLADGTQGIYRGDPIHPKGKAKGKDKDED